MADKQFLDIDGTEVIANHIKSTDARADDLLISTLTIEASSFVGGTYTVTGGDEEYTGDITDDTVELALKGLNTEYKISISFEGTNYDASITTGKYFNHYVVDKFEEYVPTPGDTLDDTDWATVSAIAQRGEASAYWAVGDTKSVTINGTVGIDEFDDATYYAFIIGFDHNSDIEGENTIHWQFAKTEDGIDVAFVDSNYNSTGSSVSYRMNTTNTNVGGWESCYMRNTILPQLLEALPSDLQAVIRDATKYTDNVGNASGSVATNVTATLDKLFLLAQYEVLADTTNINTYETDYQKQYDYYAAGNSTIKYRSTATGTACTWWLRSPYRSSATNFRFVNTSGGSSDNNARYSLGVAAAFVI